MMLLNIILALVLPVTALPSVGYPSHNAPKPSKKCGLHGSGISQRDALVAMLEDTYVKRDVNALYKYYNPDIITHEPDTLDGVVAAIEDRNFLHYQDAVFTYQNIIPPCGGTNLAAIKYKYVLGPNSPKLPNQAFVANEVFRYEGPCIAEGWFNYVIPAENTTSHHPYFNDDLTEKPFVPKCH